MTRPDAKTTSEPVRVVLVHSPRVGGDFWHPVARALHAHGTRALTPRLPSLEYSYAPFWLAHAAGLASGLPEDGSVVLVAHSAAGVLLPAMGKLAGNRARSARVLGYVFVDCDLPRDGASCLELWDDQPAAHALRTRVGLGDLPRFTDDELRPLLPDDAQRAAFVAAAPRVPMYVYDEPVMVPATFATAPRAYLALSRHYEGAWRTAEAEDWPRRRLDLHHFAPLTHADVVAEAIGALFHIWLEDTTADAAGQKGG